jgi:predicted phage terminase large subunit-like protein
VDPATGKTTGDYSAIAVVAKHRPTGLYYVLYCRGFKESDLALARRICEVYRLFRPDFIDFETVQFQAIYKREVAREGSRQGLRLPLRPFKGGNKHVRIKSLGPMFENGLILLQEDQTLLKEHLINYPRGHDDCPDALEMCISGLESTFTAGVVIGKRQVVSAAQRLAGIAQRLGGRFR